MIVNRFLPMIAFWRRRQYGSLPVINGSVKFCNESFSTPLMNGDQFDVAHACKDAFAVAEASDSSFGVAGLCNAAFVTEEISEGFQ